MNLSQYNKAFVPLGVAVVLGLLSAVHITGSMSVSDAVTFLITSIVVYLVPNKPA